MPDSTCGGTDFVSIVPAGKNSREEEKQLREAPNIKGTGSGLEKKKKGDEGRIPKTPGAWEAPEDVQGRGTSGIWSFPTLPGAPLGWGRENPTFPAAGMVLGTLQIFIGKGKMEKWGPAGV